MLESFNTTMRHCLKRHSLLLLLTSMMPILSNSLELPQEHRIPGGIAIINIGQHEKPPTVTFNNTRVKTLQSEQDQWLAVVGIPLTQSPGEANIQVNDVQHPFSVSDFAYKEQRLTVSKKHVQLSDKNLQRVRKESKLIRNAFQQYSATQLHSTTQLHPTTQQHATTQTFQRFDWPVKGPMSSPFGLKRFFNDKPRKPHSGLDIAAPTGTPIVAPAAGKVVLTGDFFFNGNSVFVDHGAGLVTMYCHLDSIQVEQGETLERGQPLGTVGATGRVTGPHLHWSVSLNNARVNPKLLLKQDTTP